MRELSERMALYTCWKIWKQIPADSLDKHNIARKVAKIIPGLLIFDEGCPCCEYKAQHDFSCEQCPLYSVWSSIDPNNDNHDFVIDNPCEDFYGSPYRMWWIIPNSYDRQFFALLIADESKRLLQENL